ncbi:MAG: hypothetical protein J6U77_05445 [Verrucomicrobia bacterium]|nr:hypothetical protein [Verrucomicrobiota bacterium]
MKKKLLKILHVTDMTIIWVGGSIIAIFIILPLLLVMYVCLYIFFDAYFPDLFVNREKVEQEEQAMRSQSGIIFPEDTVFVRGRCEPSGEYGEYNYQYISKVPFQLPEDLNDLCAESAENQMYYLKLGSCKWASDEPFEIPVDLEELASKWHEDKESLISRVENMKKKGEKWETECDFDFHEKWFSNCFRMNINGATDYWSANWVTNRLAFEAIMLKTPEKCYLDLYCKKVRPSKALEVKEVAVE